MERRERRTCGEFGTTGAEAVKYCSTIRVAHTRSAYSGGETPAVPTVSVSSGECRLICGGQHTRTARLLAPPSLHCAVYKIFIDEKQDLQLTESGKSNVWPPVVEE